jgi:hypothetical protein
MWTKMLSTLGIEEVSHGAWQTADYAWANGRTKSTINDYGS